MNPEGGDGNFTHYHLTDHQFSTVALIDNSAKLLERVSYDAYGKARHHWAADITGNGAVGVADQDAMATAHRSSIGQSDYNVDADISRTGQVNNQDLEWTTTSSFKAALPIGALSAPTIGNSIGYAGYVFNAEIPGGLYTVRFRHYDPGLGRWLERDPLGYVDGMSLYEYLRSAPPLGLDPYGQFTIIPALAGGGIGGVFGGIVGGVRGGWDGALRGAAAGAAGGFVGGLTLNVAAGMGAGAIVPVPSVDQLAVRHQPSLAVYSMEKILIQATWCLQHL